MGLRGTVGNGGVKVKIGRRVYHYIPEMERWYNSRGEDQFQIPLDLDGRRFYYDASGRRFLDEHHTALSVTENIEAEGRVKKKYDVNGDTRFFHFN